MIAFLSDENFRNSIIRGLKRQQVDVDVVRVQDVGLSGADDDTILAWAAEQGRVLVTHDVNTVPGTAWDRVGRSQPMAGVVAVPERTPTGEVIDNLVLLAACGHAEDCIDQVLYLPL